MYPIDDFLNAFNVFLPKVIRDFSCQNDLQQALLYATLNGGKRTRPVLCFIFGSMVNKNIPIHNILHVASAVELIHCYSLVHDDLPAMDNDDLRRGLPTTHKKYTEATAILVGDSLQTMAFDILSSDVLNCSSDTKIKLIQILSKASGAMGMVSGQFLDMNLDSQFDKNNLLHIKQMHQQKTGALITAACVMGAVIGDIKNQAIQDKAKIIGGLIGELFQIQDDILDMTQSTQTLGKTAGKDLTNNKPTITAFMGLDNARFYADDLVQKL
jgi:geranylgeranyl pyrophosphate synthase